MMDFGIEIKRLQKLSCIALSPEEEKKLGQQLKEIIDFLGQLPDLTTNNEKGITKTERTLTLRTIRGIEDNINNKKIMKNVKHSLINNSIVIKSVLS